MNEPKPQSYGWIPPESRSQEMQAADAMALAQLPIFEIVGSYQHHEKAFLFDARRKITGQQNPPYIWQSTGSCFPAGTPVRMASGEEKPIEMIRSRDEVFTHQGRSRQVVRTMHRKFSGKMITVEVCGFPFPLRMTEDHPVAVMRSNANWRWQPDRLEWINAGKLTKDDRLLIGLMPSDDERPSIDASQILGESCIILDDLMAGDYQDVPLSRECVARKAILDSGDDWKGRVKLTLSRNKNAIFRHIRVTPSFGRLIGLYLAEGGVNEKRVTFTFNANEEHLADEVIALIQGIFGVDAFKVTQKNRPTVLKVRVPNANVAAVITHFVPGDIYSKRVPKVLMVADEQVKIATLLGWLDGDGYAALKKGNKPTACIQGVSASAGLVRDMATLALSCGMRATSSKRRPRKQSREAFDLYLSGKKILDEFPTLKQETLAVRSRPLSDTDTRRCEFGYCQKIKSIDTEQVDDLPVFDFEVEEDHSFIAGGLVVHNCVGAGGGNCLLTLRDVEITLGELETPKMIWWLFPYGESREIAGMRGRGEGSFGSAYAKAITQRGIFAADVDPQLPAYQDRNGWYYLDRETEFSWSDGFSIPEKWNTFGRDHLVKSMAKISNAQQAGEALQNGYPLTCASMFGTSGPRLQGDPPVLLAAWDGRWAHQMFVDGWWDHPSLGEIFRIGNSWGPHAHGTCPVAPAGGFWVRKSVMDRICQSEVFAMSAFAGFPARSLWYDLV